MLESRVVSSAIAAPFDVVNEFLAAPANMPKWAEGLGRSFSQVGIDLWHVETPMGAMNVRFTPRNAFGVIDHWVIPAGSEPMYNPMRVIANGEGVLVTFTLFHRPGMDDEEFEADARTVAKDLAVLKDLMESQGR